MNWFKRKKEVTLELSPDGFYCVKVCGQWISSTVTKNKEEAEKYFSECLKAAKYGVKHTIIKREQI